jgi:hypothetical protein
MRDEAHPEPAATWRAVALDRLRAYEVAFHAVVAAFFALAALLNASVIIHVTTVEIGALTAVEASAGQEFAAVMEVQEALLSLAVQTAAALASGYMAVSGGILDD